MNSPSEKPSTQSGKVFFPIAGLLLLFFLWECVSASNPLRIESTKLVELGAAYLPLVRGGDWWRLLFAVMIHSGAQIIAINLICLLRFGEIATRLFGGGRAVLIFLLGAIAGNLFSLYFYPFVPATGASGAVAALFGALWGASMSEPKRAAEFKRDPTSILLFCVMIFLSFDRLNLLGMSFCGFLVGFLIANFGYSAYLARMGGLMAKREQMILVFFFVIAALVAADLPRIPNILGVLQSSRELSKRSAQRTGELSGFYTNNEAKKIDFLQKELLEPWQRQETELNELKNALGSWMDKPAIASEIEKMLQSAAANILCYQSLIVFSKQKMVLAELKSKLESNSIDDSEYLNVLKSKIFSELQRARSELKGLHGEPHIASSDELISFTEEQQQSAEKEAVSSYVKVLALQRSQWDTAKLERFSTLFEPKNTTEKSIAAALKFSKEEMQAACLEAKQLHAELEQFTKFFEAEMVELVANCEEGQALARATAMDALVRLRFSYLFERISNKKIERDQALEFVQKLIDPILLEDFSGDKARIPASGQEKADAEFEKIKNIQLARREAIVALEEGIKEGKQSSILRSKALWLATDHLADRDLRSIVLSSAQKPATAQ